MSKETGALHLDSLSIRGFRGLSDLKVPRLGRVTLVAGKNGIGKTTVLDAVRIYAARANIRILNSILTTREEFVSNVDELGREDIVPDFRSLFYGRLRKRSSRIEIGPIGKKELLEIRPADLEDFEKERLHWSAIQPGFFDEEILVGLKIGFAGHLIAVPNPVYERTIRSYLRHIPEWEYGRRNATPEINCTQIGPGLLGNERIAQFWDKVALTNDESRVVDALQLLYGDKIQRATLIGDGRSRSKARWRAVIKTTDHDERVPLKSLGDGAVRMFGLALALASSQGGILVIDEVENGIHHSAQAEFWSMILRAAREINVQVIATTHGWSCVSGFAQALSKTAESDGALVRIERSSSGMRAVEYSGEDLRVAAEQGIEVR